MAKKGGNPDNLQPFKTDRDEPLTEQINLRVTKSMKDEVQKQPNPPEFIREAIQEKLDKQKDA